jgi:hypothetical protein
MAVEIERSEVFATRRSRSLHRLKRQVIRVQIGTRQLVRVTSVHWTPEKDGQPVR